MADLASALTDDELMNRLKHLAAQWFKNTDILLLEELFRRYRKAQQKGTPHGTR